MSYENRKTTIGTVVSDKMEKTIIVRVDRRIKHPVYGKYITRSVKFMAHDENNECGIGDKVKIIESRPLSAHKRWRLVEVIAKAEII
jgi:small subunit ribosomal protein S17